MLNFAYWFKFDIREGPSYTLSSSPTMLWSTRSWVYSYGYDYYQKIRRVFGHEPKHNRYHSSLLAHTLLLLATYLPAGCGRISPIVMPWPSFSLLRRSTAASCDSLSGWWPGEANNVVRFCANSLPVFLKVNSKAFRRRTNSFWTQLLTQSRHTCSINIVSSTAFDN